MIRLRRPEQPHLIRYAAWPFRQLATIVTYTPEALSCSAATAAPGSFVRNLRGNFHHHELRRG
jgi:hypothetical protein